MGFSTQWRALTPDQRNAFVASFLGWTLDAFDYFVLVFVIDDIAREFHVDPKRVTYAVMLTLMMRPVGAFLFGAAADRYGRRVPLMINIVCYSLLELLSGVAPTLTAFLVLRAAFGIAMGGEWGLGASLAMETVPEKARGLLSGILQEGYAVGYLLAALVYPLIVHQLGWRGMFFVGVLPALLSLFVRARVKESPVWQAARAERPPVPVGRVIMQNLPLFLYMVLLMTAFNFMSHGTQDIYPLFLKIQLHFSPRLVSTIAVIYNIGAVCGGIVFGSLSQRIGRRRAIIGAALLALPIVPLWTFSHTALGLAAGAFLMQFLVQGAWGIVPAHLSELAPAAARGTFTGLAYQLGNLLSSRNAPLQTGLAESWGNNYGRALATVVPVVLLAVALITALGRERRGAALGSDPN